MSKHLDEKELQELFAEIEAPPGLDRWRERIADVHAEHHEHRTGTEDGGAVVTELRPRTAQEALAGRRRGRDRGRRPRRGGRHEQAPHRRAARRPHDDHRRAGPHDRAHRHRRRPNPDVPGSRTSPPPTGGAPTGSGRRAGRPDDGGPAASTTRTTRRRRWPRAGVGADDRRPVGVEHRRPAGRHARASTRATCGSPPPVRWSAICGSPAR